MAQPRAFALVELFVVVCIIALLTMIAVPRFLDADTRSRTASTFSEMRSIAHALESYKTDHGTYPWIVSLPGYHLPAGGTYSGHLRAGLTTPVAYMSSLPVDPFSGTKVPSNDPYGTFGTTRGFWYWSEAYFAWAPWGGPASWTNLGPGADAPGSKWAVMSRGPDQYWAHMGHEGGAAAEVNRPLLWHYDTTNGTLSWGNIARLGP